MMEKVNQTPAMMMKVKNVAADMNLVLTFPVKVLVSLSHAQVMRFCRIASVFVTLLEVSKKRLMVFVIVPNKDLNQLTESVNVSYQILSKMVCVSNAQQDKSQSTTMAPSLAKT
jgi:hypothetical protein